MNPASVANGARALPWRWHAGGLAALLAAIAATYAGALHAPFQFDDWWALVQDPRVQSLPAWWQSLPGIRPLLKLSFALNASLSDAAWTYRLANLGCHAANGALLWTLLRQHLPRLAPGVSTTLVAWFVALLFVLHPATTEAVTYLSGRSVSLMATFYLLALILLGRSQQASRPMAWQALATLCFAAALAIRETAVTLPLAWLLLARCGGQGWREALRPLAGPAAVLAMAAVAAWMTPGYHSFFGWSLQARGLGPQLLGQVDAHAYLLAGPLPGRVLNIDPDLRVPEAFAPRHALWLGFAATALAVGGWQRRRWPWLLFAMAWYLLHLAPSNSLMPRLDLANDRHLYLALPGPLLALAVVLAGLRARALGQAALLVCALALGLQTLARNRDYRSELALWQATVHGSPAKARPWTNLGYARQQQGDLAGAAAAYRCALDLDPGHRQAAWNLAALASAAFPARPGDCDLP